MAAAQENKQNFSMFLFTAPDGKPMEFHMTPCPQKQILQSLVEDGGGLLSSSNQAEAYRLLAPSQVARSKNVYSYKFIHDCVKQNRLLDIDLYRIPIGETVVDCSDTVKENDAVVKISDADRKGRSKYTAEEEKAILCGLLRNERYKHCGGNEVWMELEQLKITNHSWQSMRDHYHKVMLPNIDTFGLSMKQKQMLRPADRGRSKEANRELEQARKSTTAVNINTRSLRSRRNEDDRKKRLPVNKQLKTAVSNSSSALPAGGSSKVSLRNNTLLPQQVRTRSSDDTKSSARHHSESTLQTSTPVKSSTREMPAVNVASRSSSPESPSSATNVQVCSKTRTVQAGVGLNSKKSENSQSSDTITASPMSTRSRSSVSFSPAKTNHESRTSHGLPWKKKAIVTYQRKHGVGKILPTKYRHLRSTASGQHESTTTDNDGSVKKRGRRKVDKVDTADSSRSKTSSVVSSSEQSYLRTIPSDKSPRKRRDVAVQADSQSSAGSSRLLRHSSLRSTASSSVGSPHGRHSNVVVESCSSGKTAVTAKSSMQYDTCFESASSQLQDAEDIDDEELDHLARLAHGSPQSAVIPRCLEDSNVTDNTTVPAERPMRASTISSTVHTRQTAAVVDDTSDASLDSGKTSSAKKRRTETADKGEDRELSPKSREVTSQLTADAGKKLMKSVPGTDNVASSQHRDNIDHRKRFGTEVLLSGVEKSSMDPVAGPSGITSRTKRSENMSKKKSSGSGRHSIRHTGLRKFIFSDTDIETSEDDMVTSSQEVSSAPESGRIANYTKIIKGTAGKLGLPVRYFMHVVCMMNGNIDDAVYWIQHAKTRSGLPAWNAVTDDEKLQCGDDAAYAELVQKYSLKAVEDRQKFLAEAECGNCSTSASC